MEIPPAEGAASASQRQFGRQAALYVTSATHRSGDSLAVVTEFAGLSGSELVLDVGTGVGFTAFALAPKSRWVLATDITAPMLAEARAEKARRGLRNVSFGLADAESLPFNNNSFNRVACRTAAHHFGDPERAVQEMTRVLAPEGLLLLADTVAPEDDEFARWMQGVEVRRDPSHSRNLAPSEWRKVLEEAGLEVTAQAMTAIPQRLRDWTRRSGRSAEETEQLLSDFLSAPPEVRDAFTIQREGDDASFRWQCAIFQARRGTSQGTGP